MQKRKWKDYKTKTSWAVARKKGFPDTAGKSKYALIAIVTTFRRLCKHSQTKSQQRG